MFFEGDDTNNMAKTSIFLNSFSLCTLEEGANYDCGYVLTIYYQSSRSKHVNFTENIVNHIASIYHLSNEICEDTYFNIIRNDVLSIGVVLQYFSCPNCHIAFHNIVSNNCTTNPNALFLVRNVESSPMIEICDSNYIDNISPQLFSTNITVTRCFVSGTNQNIGTSIHEEPSTAFHITFLSNECIFMKTEQICQYAARFWSQFLILTTT